MKKNGKLESIDEDVTVLRQRTDGFVQEPTRSRRSAKKSMEYRVAPTID